MSAKSVLVSWVGDTDLRAPDEPDRVGRGPLGQAVDARTFDEIVVLSNYPLVRTKPYLTWLRAITKTPVRLEHVALSAPTAHGEIFEGVIGVLRTIKEVSRDRINFTFHLSPGTPAMHAMWVLIAKCIHPAELIDSHKDRGVRTVSIPFEISAEYLPALPVEAQEDLIRLAQGLTPETPGFKDIVYRCAEMKRVIARAYRVSQLDEIPVLILGESGTGKELLARAIHDASPRSKGPWMVVNCGAIPSELVESELFGHRKGSFTGADEHRTGSIEEADGGTLFLDEIGELPLPAQVKLLRVLQDKQVFRVGERKGRKVDFRVVAATNRDLQAEVVRGNFREDLFHRLAIGVLRLPPVRERKGDLGLLIDTTMNHINKSRISSGEDKELSASARSVVARHPWPGNVRELANTLTRAAIFSSGPKIQAKDIEEALLVPSSSSSKTSVLEEALGGDFSLKNLLTDVKKHYVRRALDEAQGNLTKAAQLLGEKNYQTIANWKKEFDL